MTRRLHVLTSLMAAVVLVVYFESYASSRSKHILAIAPKARPTDSRPKQILAFVPQTSPPDLGARVPANTPFALPPDALGLPSMNAMPADAPAIKQAIELVRKRKISQATEIKRWVRDPMGQRLIEWVILRFEDSGADFDRYAAFIRDNPAWPSLGLVRRRAEGTLWQERRDAVTGRRFLLNGKPTSARGRLALGRRLLNQGDRSGAEREVRETWASGGVEAHADTARL